MTARDGARLTPLLGLALVFVWPLAPAALAWGLATAAEGQVVLWLILCALVSGAGALVVALPRCRSALNAWGLALVAAVATPLYVLLAVIIYLVHCNCLS